MWAKIRSRAILLPLLIIGFLVILIIYNNYQKTCCAEPVYEVSSNKLSVNLDGYFMTCTGYKTVSKKVKGSWEEVKKLSSYEGGYYLDDEFVEFLPENNLGCDYLACTEIENPLTVDLIEHKKIGEKAPPPGSKNAQTVDVFQTTPLLGEIKVDIDYYSDGSCNDKKTFSATFEQTSSN